MDAGSRDSRPPNVTTDEGYLKGWFEVQDQGSQMVAALAGARPGEQVLDLCAGAGGKTLALSAMMQGKGRLIATDHDKRHLAPIYDRLSLAGLHNCAVRTPKVPNDPFRDLQPSADLGLDPAPCPATRP